MRKVIIVLCIMTFLVGLAGLSYGYPKWKAGGFLYAEVIKQTNSSYMWKLPALECVIEKGRFFFEPEVSLIFTAPRNNLYQLDHHSFLMNFNVGIQDFGWKGTFASVSLGARNIFSGNADGLPAGVEWSNVGRLGMEIN